jgi:hypothetical protein
MLVESGIDFDSFVREFAVEDTMPAGESCPDRGEPIIRKRYIWEEAQTLPGRLIDLAS